MANIKDLKKKIKTTKGTFKITTAMKLVSAAKLAKAQQAIVNSRPYADELNATIKTISALVQDYKHPYLSQSENPLQVLLVISSNKGLCGSYNSQLVKTVRQFLSTQKDKTKVFFIGKKAKDLLKNEVNMGTHYQFKKNEANFQDLRGVAEELAKLFQSGEVGKVLVAYNKFKSAISFEPQIVQALPISLKDEEKKALEQKYPFDFKYDPNPSEILDSLIPLAYNTSVYTCLLDATASEHGSRMSAMDNATKNCKEMIRSLTLKMNKKRQASITTELIEVISGAESLNN